VAINHVKNHEIRLRVKGFRPCRHTIGVIYRVGLPSIVMQSLSSVMVFGMNKILITFTETAVNVFGVYYKLQSFVFMTERRDYGNEFSWYVNAEGLSTGMSTVGLDASKGSNVPFLRFAKAPFTPAGGDAPEVAFQFSEQCPVRLVYDEAGSVYLKEAYGEAHKDGETQLAFQNVLVLFSETGEKPDDTGAVDYLFGTGQGWYCFGGKSMPVTWAKESEQAPLELFDENGQALRVNTGKTYLAFVPEAQQSTLNLAQAAQTASSAPSGSSPASSSAAA